MENFTAIVLSAGSGSRMKSDIPKQYLDLDGFPVIYYSLKAFQDSPVSSIILVTGKNDVDYCRKEIVEKYNLTKVKAIVAGGKERYDSVFEGLKAAAGSDYVMIHDGARPVLTADIIGRCWDAAILYKACVAGMPVKDTIRVVDDNTFSETTPDRSRLWLMQTPQSFSYELLYKSYSKVYEDMNSGKDVPSITDDAMIVEYGSETKVKIIEGAYENIKITTPEDLIIAKSFLKKS